MGDKNSKGTKEPNKKPAGIKKPFVVEVISIEKVDDSDNSTKAECESHSGMERELAKMREAAKKQALLKKRTKSSTRAVREGSPAARLRKQIKTQGRFGTAPCKCQFCPVHRESSSMLKQAIERGAAVIVPPTAKAGFLIEAARNGWPIVFPAPSRAQTPKSPSPLPSPVAASSPDSDFPTLTQAPPAEKAEKNGESPSVKTEEEEEDEEDKTEPPQNLNPEEKDEK